MKNRRKEGGTDEEEGEIRGKRKGKKIGRERMRKKKR